MTIRILLFLALAALPALVSAQRWFTRSATVYFNATAPNSPETIDAKLQSGTLVIDAATGKVEAAVLIKAFIFHRALMQEHFNENYLVSTKYPKAIFKGKIDNLTEVNLAQNGKYTLKLSGQMTMHGVTKPLSTNAIVEVQGSQVKASAEFQIKLADFDIRVPGLVSDKVGKVAQVSFTGNLEPMK